jgi:hypothetical protein
MKQSYGNYLCGKMDKTGYYLDKYATSEMPPLFLKV